MINKLNFVFCVIFALFLRYFCGTGNPLFFKGKQQLNLVFSQKSGKKRHIKKEKRTKNIQQREEKETLS